MRINDLKKWIDKGFVLHNKSRNNYTITIRKQVDDNYRFLYGVTIENSYKIIEKDWVMFLEKVEKFLKENKIEL